MSLILEALRKSEAERRRGLPPDLHAELPPVSTPRKRAVSAGWWWLLPAVAALAVIAWLTLRPAGPAPVASRPPPATHTPAPSPAQSAPRQPATALPQRTPTATAPAPVAAAATATATEPPASAAVAPAGNAVADTRTPVATPATPTRVAPPPAAPSSATPPADAGRVLLVGELDGDTRRALPPLKLSMHLWNEDPSRRFVILDGQRLGEGDRVGEATITRIERDGVLLDWNGRGIRVPVR